MVITATEAFLGGLCAMLSSIMIVLAGVRWIYRRGKSDQELISSLEAITTANQKMSKALDKFTERTDSQIRAHELRLVLLENRNGNSNGTVRQHTS